MSMIWLMAAATTLSAPSADCQAAIAPVGSESDVTEQALAAGARSVDGTSLRSVADLVELRRSTDALLIIRDLRLPGADFRDVRLHRLCFVDSDLSNSDWRGAEAPGIGFIRSSLARARMERARLPRLLIRDSDLTHVEATGASLAGGRMDGGWAGAVSNLRLDRGDMNGFRFECGITIEDGCPTDGEISLRGADLEGASLFRNADLAEARINATEVDLWELETIRRARIEGPVILRGGVQRVRIEPHEVRVLLSHLDTQPPEPDAPLPAAAAPPSWLSPGTFALFTDSAALFDRAFSRTGLYQRLLPLIADAAWARVVVHVRADGSLAATGDAIGGNAHQCTLSAAPLTLDPITGFHSLPSPEAEDIPAPWAGRPIPVLRISGEKLEVWRNGRGGGADDGDPSIGDNVSCGARAGFGAMVRLPVEPERVRILFELPGG